MPKVSLCWPCPILVVLILANRFKKRQTNTGTMVQIIEWKFIIFFLIDRLLSSI